MKKHISKYERRDLRKKLREKRELVILRLIERDGQSCVECGIFLRRSILTIDHKKPIIKGGTNAIKNLQLMCRNCNQRKGNAWYQIGSSKSTRDIAEQQSLKETFALVKELNKPSLFRRIMNTIV